MARLTKGTEAKASMKMRESLGHDPKPDDLFVGKPKFFERRMEG